MKNSIASISIGIAGQMLGVDVSCLLGIYHFIEASLKPVSMTNRKLAKWNIRVKKGNVRRTLGSAISWILICLATYKSQ